MVEKTINTETKANLQPPSRTREIDSKYPKGYKLLATKKKTMSIASIKIETRTKLSITLLLLTQVSLRFRLSRKTNIIKAIEEVIQLLELIPLKLPKK